jgi:two-component system response regulator RegX3
VSEAARIDSEPGERIQAGDVVLDRAAHLVTVRGHALVLAMQEFRLLELLMAHADHVVSSTTILESVWGRQFDGDPGTIAVHVLRLRKKLERFPGASRHLRTVRGLGYVFDSEPVEG